MSDRIKQLTTHLICATLGVAVVYVLSKHRRRALQSLNNWKKTLLDPLGHQNVVVVNSDTECKTIIRSLKMRCSKFGVLGFDCEWVTTSGRRHPVALLQLASADGVCALIRICKIRHIPVDLKNLLEDASILKVGVAPSDDAKYLLHDYNVIVRGCLDLRHLAAQNAGGPVAKGGLAGLANSLLGVQLDKSWRIRCSDWEADELTERQAAYAALDALVAVEVFNVLVQKLLRPWGYLWKPSYWRSEDYDTGVSQLCKRYVDVKYRNKPQQASSGDAPLSVQGAKNSVVKLPRNNLKPISRAYTTRQRPLYHNCYMQAPDGMVLCTCDRKKAEWYVLKDLGEVVSQKPYTVRLKFEPSGRAVGEVGNYYTQEKANCCVVCGRTDTYIRKNIVPHEYRKFFPRVMKDHTSHDVLLLCLDCHQLTNISDISLREQLGVECGAPIQHSQEDAKTFEMQGLRRVKLAARALLNCGDRIPEQRKEELKKVILELFTDYTEVNEDLLQIARNVESSVLNQDYEPHGLKVVQHYSCNGGQGLVRLEQLWRQHFLSTMKPRFMPTLWSVTHNHHRLAQRAEENRIEPQDLCAAGLQHLV